MATGSVGAFTPAGTLALSASTGASVQGAIPSSDAVLVTNTSTAIAFVAFGVTTATATASATPVPAGAQLLLGTGRMVGAVAVTLGGTGASGTVYVTYGAGTQH